jgi:hypothetical protein
MGRRKPSLLRGHCCIPRERGSNGEQGMDMDMGDQRRLN